MLLSCMTILSLVIGSSAYETEKRCHGERFTFPPSYSPPRFREKMYFGSSKGGSQRLVMDEGVIQDPRIKVSDNSVYMDDLTERDSGTFSVIYGFFDRVPFNVIRLEVSDCAKPFGQSYGETCYISVPEPTEIMEYSPGLSNPVVLWNRSDHQTSQGGMRQVGRGVLKITNVTQEDNGYYDFWGKDRKLLSRILLTVEGKHIRKEKNVGEELIMRYPSANSAWTVIFQPKGWKKKIILVNSGILIIVSNSAAKQFIGRVKRLDYGVKINPLETSDSGTYEFIDPQNNVGLTVLLEVKTVPPSKLVIGFIIAGIIVAAVICFCCVRRCCRKRSSSNRGQAAPRTTAAPPVCYNDQNQSSGPSYSVAHAPVQSYQPVNPGVSGGTAASSSKPATYSIDMKSLVSEFSPLGGQGDTSAPSFSSDCLSSDPGPRFELKGLNASFADPLSSDSTVSDVYSSDKLNFL